MKTALITALEEMENALYSTEKLETLYFAATDGDGTQYQTELFAVHGVQYMRDLAEKIVLLCKANDLDGVEEFEELANNFFHNPAPSASQTEALNAYGALLEELID